MSVPTDLTPRAFEDALIQGDRERCAAIVVALMADGRSALAIYEGHFKPALYAVGSLWERNLLSVASEHLATAIIEGAMNDVFPRLMSLERRGETAIVSPVPGELHQVGARMACDVLEMHGWDAVLLSGETSVESLVTALREGRPQMAGLSISLQHHVDTLRRTVMAIRDALPTLPILVGGRALTDATATTLSATQGVLCFRDLHELHRYLTRCGARAA
jgi:methanogenic corrinoid protein MtbC1